ncbi:hypothetical protein [Massilia glaciei]|uniref:DUF3551 domain-containing protein n=1 Tax=Massilia glaciei TaxID=1524097 RepID=A0A2U2H967_9BURK|nr:hypothetical protein [Massilia glaciei]PWF39104.1 hypothetical protein C7C56_027320 [Massilia glaciei]
MRLVTLGCCGLALLFSTSLAAAPKLPAAGGFGFDWTGSKRPRCAVIPREMVGRFQRCEYTASGGFGLADPVHACRLDKVSEYMVFATKAACARNLKIMQANGP